jgi:hypothetical protein
MAQYNWIDKKNTKPRPLCKPGLFACTVLVIHNFNYQLWLRFEREDCEDKRSRGVHGCR